MVNFKLHHSIRLGFTPFIAQGLKEMKENALFAYPGSMPEVPNFSVKGLTSPDEGPKTFNVLGR